MADVVNGARRAPARATEPVGWRYLAALMVAIQILTLISAWYFWNVYSDNLAAIENADQLCFAPKTTEFESIRSAQMMGRLDVLTLIFGVVATTLGLFALTGFWIFRREVLGKASDVVADMVPELVPDEVRIAVADIFRKPEAGEGSGEMFTPEDVSYDSRVQPEEVDEAPGTTPDHPEPSNDRPRAGRDDSPRSRLGRLRDWLLARSPFR